MGTISKFDHLIFLFKNNIFDNLEFEVKSLTLSPSNLISSFVDLWPQIKRQIFRKPPHGIWEFISRIILRSTLIREFSILISN